MFAHLDQIRPARFYDAAPQGLTPRLINFSRTNDEEEIVPVSYFGDPLRPPGRHVRVPYRASSKPARANVRHVALRHGGARRTRGTAKLRLACRYARRAHRRQI